MLGYSLQNLKGISLVLCTHCIPIDPNSIPSREPQRRLNNAMQEVVKKEVLKLLHTGIIYPFPHSEWVSPVQVVPKKGGVMVLTNEKNELIPVSYGCEYILVTVDYVSKWVEAISCKHADHKQARKLFQEYIFPQFRTPRMIISDGGSHFIHM